MSDVAAVALLAYLEELVVLEGGPQWGMCLLGMIWGS